MTDHTPITATMTTLYNRKVLHPFTIEGLFERVQQYFEQHPTAPACETQVTVRLNGDWAFPRQIIEDWVDDCPAEGPSPRLVVMDFATLTPTPTPLPTATVTPRPTTTPEPTVTVRPSVTPFARNDPTPAESPTPATHTVADQGTLPIWAVLLTGVAATAMLVFLWKARN